MYKFNLEFLRQYRHQKEETEMYKMAEALRTVNKIQSELEHIQNRAGELVLAARNKAGEKTNAPTLELYSKYLHELRWLKEDAHNRLIQADKSLENQRRALTQASIDRKAVDRLKEIKQLAFLNEQAQKEMKALDESAVIKAGRKRYEQN